MLGWTWHIMIEMNDNNSMFCFLLFVMRVKNLFQLAQWTKRISFPFDQNEKNERIFRPTALIIEFIFVSFFFYLWNTHLLHIFYNIRYDHFCSHAQYLKFQNHNFMYAVHTPIFKQADKYMYERVPFAFNFQTGDRCVLVFFAIETYTITQTWQYSVSCIEQIVHVCETADRFMVLSICMYIYTYSLWESLRSTCM